MRLRDDEIELVVGHIVGKLTEADCLELEATGEELFLKLRMSLVADLMVEDNLNREVEEILREHMKNIESSSIDYRMLFYMI
jgi:hypothetical protein